MKIDRVRGYLSACAVAALIALSATSVLPQETRDKKKISEQSEEGRREARNAEQVLGDVMNVPEKAIPRELLERAQAIAIFTDVVKAAFVIGGRGGDGVVMRKTGSGWSVPVFYDMGGASFGAQIGAEKTDYVMLFMNEGALKDLLDEKVELGAEVSVAAGPVGRTAGVGTNPTLDAGILTWSRSKGAFIGAAIKGAVLTADNDINRALYGMIAKDILAKPESVKTSGLPREVTSLSGAVARYAAGSK